MYTSRKFWLPAVAVLLLLPCGAFGASFVLDSSCLVGAGLDTCPPSGAGTINYGSSISGNGSQLFTVNSDQYLAQWTFAASYTINGTYILFDPMVSYLGAIATAQNDVITFDMMQNYFDSSPGTWDGTYNENVPLFLSSTVGAGSWMSAVLEYGLPSQPLPTVTLSTPGFIDAQGSANLTGLTNNTLQAQYNFTFDFQQGTAPGAIEGPIPEPAQALPVGLALVGFYLLFARSRSGYIKIAGGRQ